MLHENGHLSQVFFTLCWKISYTEVRLLRLLSEMVLIKSLFFSISKIYSVTLICIQFIPEQSFSTLLNLSISDCVKNDLTREIDSRLVHLIYLHL